MKKTVVPIWKKVLNTRENPIIGPITVHKEDLNKFSIENNK